MPRQEIEIRSDEKAEMKRPKVYKRVSLFAWLEDLRLVCIFFFFTIAPFTWLWVDWWHGWRVGVSCIIGALACNIMILVYNAHSRAKRKQNESS